MRLHFPLMVSLSLLATACGEPEAEKEDLIDTESHELIDTDMPEEEPSPTILLSIDAESILSSDLYSYDDKLQVLVGSEGLTIDIEVDPAGTEVTWSSSEPSVVEVSSSGELRFLGDGEAEITVSAGEVSDSLLVEVADQIARTQFTLNQQRYGESGNGGGEGGEGGEGGVFLTQGLVRTSAVAEGPPNNRGQTVPPVPVTMQVDYCGGNLFAGSPSGYTVSWRPDSLRTLPFSSNGINFCSETAQARGPYLLTQPLEIVSGEDAFVPSQGDSALDTADTWSATNNLCAFAVEGHNAFVMEEVTFPEDASTQLRVQARFANNFSSNAGFEVSAVDHETGELLVSSENRTFYAEDGEWGTLNIEINSQVPLAGKTVDLWVDLTGRPDYRSAHGEANLWLDDIKIFTEATPQTPPILSKAPNTDWLDVKTETCDSLDDLRAVRMFEARTLLFTRNISNFGPITRHLFIPHDEPETFVRYLDTFTNTSGEEKTRLVNYSVIPQTQASDSPASRFLPNRRGYLRTPPNHTDLSSNEPDNMAISLVVGEGLSPFKTESYVAATPEFTLTDGESIAYLSFEPISIYMGGRDATADEENLEARMEAIITSFASAPLSSPYAEGISPEQWDLVQGWSNPDPLTPIGEDTAESDTGF